jgi:hypothetical protein
MNPYEIAVIVAVACLGFSVLMAWWSSDRVAKATEETEKAWGVADERGDAITELEAMVVELTDRNERLHEDQRRMRERLPALANIRPLDTDFPSAWDSASGSSVDFNLDVAPPAAPVYDVGYLSLPLEIQRELERDWHERHLGPSGDQS